jgi:hypothetical protein
MEVLSSNDKLPIFAFYETIAGFITTVIMLARFIGLLPDVVKIDKV